MNAGTVAWLEGLRAAATAARQRPPRGPRPSAACVAAERAVLAADFVTWIDGELPGLLAERAAARARGHEGEAGADPEPAIVLMTSPVGLVAAADVLSRRDPLLDQWRPRLAVVTEVEYRAWCMRHPDDGYRHHVLHWNWLKTRVPPQRWPAFAAWPLREGECYWLHRLGTADGMREHRACHLWKWNGLTSSLVAPFIVERLPSR